MKSKNRNEKRMAVTTAVVLLAVVAGAWQAKLTPVQKKRYTANSIAESLASMVQDRATKTREYDNNLSSYAREFGGKLPINPCTGTRTGYTMTVNGKTAVVAAQKGKLCGDWTPRMFPLTLLGNDPISKQGRANTNARALATAVQARAINTNRYDSNLASYAVDMGGTIPINPCTGTRTGYKIVVHKDQTAEVAAQKGKLCGQWIPMNFNLTL